MTYHMCHSYEISDEISYYKVIIAFVYLPFHQKQSKGSLKCICILRNTGNCLEKKSDPCKMFDESRYHSLFLLLKTANRECSTANFKLIAIFIFDKGTPSENSE